MCDVVHHAVYTMRYGSLVIVLDLRISVFRLDLDVYP